MSTSFLKGAGLSCRDSLRERRGASKRQHEDSDEANDYSPPNKNRKGSESESSASQADSGNGDIATPSDDFVLDQPEDAITNPVVQGTVVAERIVKGRMYHEIAKDMGKMGVTVENAMAFIEGLKKIAGVGENSKPETVKKLLSSIEKYNEVARGEEELMPTYASPREMSIGLICTIITERLDKHMEYSQIAKEHPRVTSDVAETTVSRAMLSAGMDVNKYNTKTILKSIRNKDHAFMDIINKGIPEAPGEEK